MVTIMNTTPKAMNTEILRVIRKSLLGLESATKVELSDNLGISFPTISKFLTQMEKDGEIISVGLDNSSGGRRAKRYRYNPEFMLGLAIFLERTETSYIVFNCKGEVKDTGNTSSPLVDVDLTLLTECVEKIIDKFPKIASLAVGVPGSVNNGRIIYIPGYEHLENFDLKGYLENHFSIPVAVENDMNAAVLGYYDSRGRKKNESLIYFYSGQNGPGAGIMVNGTVVRGSTNFSGEVSFVPQYDDRNFWQALKNGNRTQKAFICEEHEIDAISRLVTTFGAIINPHTIIFCDDEVNQDTINEIVKRSSKYFPPKHLPELIMSDWKQDYLFGLQNLSLEGMFTTLKSKTDRYI